MRVVICDDIQKDMETIRTALHIYSTEHPECHVEIDKYSAAIDVLRRMEKGETYDIALMDICMPGVTGTDAAEEMLAKNLEMSVIFLTGDQVLLSLECVNGAHRVRISEIASIESQNHYFLLMLSSGESLKLRMKLSQMFEEIQKYPAFIRAGGVEEVQRAYMEVCRKEARK